MLMKIKINSVFVSREKLYDQREMIKIWRQFQPKSNFKMNENWINFSSKLSRGINQNAIRGFISSLGFIRESKDMTNA